MELDHSGVKGWKQWALGLLNRATFRTPYVSELVNQGISKNLGLLAGWHFLSRTGVTGDYAEFGVFRGETFRSMIDGAQRIYGAIGKTYPGRFLAFDSFQGLPEVPSMLGSTNIYKKGDFRSPRQEFDRTLGKHARSERVIAVEGFFSESLTPALSQKLQLRRLAFVNIDCDLYESTRDALNFITPYLVTGSLIYFDDWFSIKGDMDEGEPKATSEWLALNPSVRLVDYKNIGITGKMFIVNRVAQA